MRKRTLLLFLAASSIALTMALLISACSKSSSSPTGPGLGAIISVTGKVIGLDNQPIASVPVLVTGLPSVNTDANGNFTIPNVTTPYSIVVVDGANFGLTHVPTATAAPSMPDDRGTLDDPAKAVR